jgi:hypothetical protein
MHYVIKLVSDLWQIGDFLRVLLFPPPIKLTELSHLKAIWNVDLKWNEEYSNNISIYGRVISERNLHILYVCYCVSDRNEIMDIVWNIHRSGYISPLTLWGGIPSRRGVLDAILCDKVCQWFVIGRRFSPGTFVSSANKTDRLDITCVKGHVYVC